MSLQCINNEFSGEVLLTVVIPTYNRQKLLPRAINSALQAERLGRVQVVVVPNGSHDGWRGVAEEFRDDARVEWFPLEVASACVARNHGMAKSKGRYIRFLDDDDYLMPLAAQQIDILERSGADFCSGLVAFVSEDGQIIKKTTTPETDDAVIATLNTDEFSLTVGNVFRLSSIHGACWPEGVRLYDDYLWQLNVLTWSVGKELRWIKLDHVVGHYVQHSQFRLSEERRSAAGIARVVEILFNMVDHGNSVSRRCAAASAILFFAHTTFLVAPIYCSKLIARTLEYCPSASPRQPIFQRYPVLLKNLILSEWCLFPLRYARKLWGDLRKILRSSP